MTRQNGWLVAIGLLSLACSGAQDTGGPPAPLPESKLGDDRRAPTPNPNAPPEGTVHSELGQAPGGTVFFPDGTELDLAATYAETNAVIVFYRGHW